MSGKREINGFKNRKAFDEFMDEAMTLESNLSRSLSYGHCETLYLFVNDNTGEIVTWCRENDPAAMILDAQNSSIYHKIPWQVKGRA